MTTIKMPNQLKELLKLQGVTGDTVGMIEDYYSNVVHEVSLQYEQDQPKEEPKKAQSIQEMARNVRIIK